MRFVLIALLLPGVMHLCGFVLEYLPLRAEELARRFRIKSGGEFHYGVLQVGATRRVGSVSVRLLEDGIVRFSGKDSEDLPWTFETAAGQEGRLFTGDLDADGHQDVIYASRTGGNGWAPSSDMVTLLFDEKGRPVPWNVDGYFESSAAGIMDLLDLNRDGKAELVRQTFDDGYWITSLYEARNGRWLLVGGEHAGRKYPMYTRFTHRANRIAVTPTAGRHPVEDDLSNTPATEGPLYLRRLNWADVRISAQPVLEFSDGRRCVAVSWYGTMTTVVDEPGQRVSATLGSPVRARQLLERIVKQKLPVWVGGRRHQRAQGAQCSVETVWATAI
ncbi:MAG: hypothetical protein JST93_04010 [Acidobacteria bacterium]|nr:hypothetical protein [Acidobacteriota bacterium]